ncbi:MAG: 2OG-Fe dioxygenase family protein [Rhizobacter sp.]
MTTTTLLPPFTAPERLAGDLRSRGHAVLSPAGLGTLAGVTPDALDALRPSWNELPPDAYLRDGGRYRRRRHSCFVVEGTLVERVPHRAHWQPVEYNALHGGLERWFEPMDAAIVAQPAWPALLSATAAVCSAAKGARPWYVEAHQFRIDTTDGIGRPTPEGAHRDGVDFVVVALVDRAGVKGGETRVFDADGPSGIRFTMTAPWTTLMLDDERVIHETTPIQPADASVPGGHRDTLVLTLRAGGFQGPAT